MSQGSKANAERMAGVPAIPHPSTTHTEYRITYQGGVSGQWHNKGNTGTIWKDTAESMLAVFQENFPDCPHRIESRQVTSWRVEVTD